MTLQKMETSTKWPWKSWSNRHQTRPTYQHIVVCIESSKMMYDKVFLSNWLPWSKHEQEIWRGTEHVLCECNYQVKSRNIFSLHLENMNVILIIISTKYFFLSKKYFIVFFFFYKWIKWKNLIIKEVKHLLKYFFPKK